MHIFTLEFLISVICFEPVFMNSQNKSILNHDYCNNDLMVCYIS